MEPMRGLVLYQFTLSPYCIKVRRILDYKGLPYDTVEVNPFARGIVRKLSGQGRVPVLVDGTADGSPLVVADSTAIAGHLDRLCPEPPVYPREPSARDRVLALEEWSDETLSRSLVPFKIYASDNARRMVEQSQRYYPPRWYHPLLRRLGPALLRHLARGRRAGRSVETLRRDFERDLDRIEELAAEAPFLAGNAPTVADFAVWGLLRTMEGLEGEDLVTRRPSLKAWYESVRRLGVRHE